MHDQIPMVLTHPKHMGPLDSPYAGSGKNILALEKKLGADYPAMMPAGGVTRAGTFEQAMLQSLDKVSGAYQRAAQLQQEAIINPDMVDVHDVTVAQAEAKLSFDITRTILSRLVQGWRDLINTR